MADIKKKPTTKVTKLAITRTTVSGNTRVMRATWTIPSAATNTNSTARATKQRVIWRITKKSKKAKNYPTHTIDAGMTYKQSDKAINGKWGKEQYTRASFYPISDWKIFSCWLKVQLGNAKGWGTAVQQIYKFEPPKVPTLGDWTFNNETGLASINIKTDAGTDKYERYDTRYTLHVVNTRSGLNATTEDVTTQSLDLDQTYNVSDYQQLDYDQHVELTLTAWSRGLAGDSKPAAKTLYVSYPAEPKISKSSVSGLEGHDKCTIYIDTNYDVAKKKNIEHPVDRVKLEYLANVPYSEASQITADADWKDAGIMDDYKCSALAIGVADVVPEPGKYTWVRVKAYHLNEDVLYRYSKPHRVEDLESPAPTAEDDDIVLVSAVPGSDGQSAVVTLGWNQDGQDDSDGTELSWADEEDTWKSTKEPEKYEFSWSDGPLTVEIGGETVTFQDSATITVKGLTEGKSYFIKARRFMEGDTRSYSEYTKPGTVITSERPETIVAACNRYINDGEPLTVRWTFSGNGIQRAWQIVQTSPSYSPTTDEVIYILTEDTEIAEGKIYYTRSGEGTEEDPYTYTQVSTPVVEDLGYYYELTEGVKEGKTYYTRSGVEGAYVYEEVANPVDADLDTYFEQSNDAVIAEGENSIGSTQIDYDRLKAFAENDNLSFSVQASTGSGWVVSSEIRISLIDRPTLEITAPTTLNAQPITITANSNRACDLTVILKSDGISGQFPEGIRYQLEGDTVHSDVYTPEWTEAQDGFTTSITLPTGLDLWDTGKYTLTVFGTDRGTGLESVPQTAEIAVAWTHQATDPSDYVTITPIDNVDAEGVHHIAAQIELTPPAGSAETDVYDIYRMDGGNAQLIGADFPLTVTTIDEYAPYSDTEELYYRVAIRTVDGDVDFSDIDYEAKFDAIRLDWAEGFLELPYNITLGDKYKKDVDIRKHLDGSYDGYWNQGIERTGSLNTDVVPLMQPGDIEMARRLARYVGPVFVRTPTGNAYEADVQITDMSVKNKPVTAIAIDATEIGITQEFQLPPYEIEEPEQEE